MLIDPIVSCFLKNLTRKIELKNVTRPFDVSNTIFKSEKCLSFKFVKSLSLNKLVCICACFIIM